MKKLISFLALSFCALAVNAQATHNMKITFQDGNTVVYGMENVKTVEFVEKEDPSAKETYTIAGVEYPMPEAVDLGLPSGTKWASMNIGAIDVYDKGGYYCWGDPTGELNFYSYGDWHELLNGGAWTSEYFGGINPPSNISGTNLDICTVRLDDSWEIPSYNDFKELIDNCDISTENNIYLIKGRNGNSIIMPSTGALILTTYTSDSSGIIEYPTLELQIVSAPCFWVNSLTANSYPDEPYIAIAEAKKNFPCADFVSLIKTKDYGFLFNGGYRNEQVPIRAIQRR